MEEGETAMAGPRGLKDVFRMGLMIGLELDSLLVIFVEEVSFHFIYQKIIIIIRIFEGHLANMHSKEGDPAILTRLFSCYYIQPVEVDPFFFLGSVFPTHFLFSGFIIFYRKEKRNFMAIYNCMSKDY